MSLTQDFVVFWQQYPRKIGKLAAQKAYAKARKGGATQHQLLDGIASYVEHKPVYADYCHPATWLNQGRWMDDFNEYETLAPKSWRASCQHQPCCQSYDWHCVLLMRERGETV